MKLWMIAWRSIQQRGLASALTMLSMALGVMMVVAVLTIHGVVSESFRNNSSLGYNMIVGAKGGKLQLTLNTVYYLSQPVENIPYDYYLEFKNKSVREAEYQHSLGKARLEAQGAALEVVGASGDALGVPGLSALAPTLAKQAIQKACVKGMDREREGKYALFTQFAIPLCLGDYYGKFRCVGTTPAMFDDLLNPHTNKPYEFSAGRNFKHYDSEHGYFECVVGSTVAREMDIKIGDGVNPAHGDPEGHTHGQQFAVVGILRPTGTPNDRAVFVNMEGFYLMDDHAKPLEKGDEEEAAAADSTAPKTAAKKIPDPLVTEQREITAMLVRTINPLVTPGLQNSINEGGTAQAVLPIQEIFNLLEFIVVPIQRLLLALTAMICVVSGISILVSIYNSMSDRRRDIAVMRALGASRWTVFAVILFEAIILSLGGGLLGSVAGHTLNTVASQQIEDQTGVKIGFTTFAPGPKVSELLGASQSFAFDPRLSLELLLIPAMMLLAVVVGIWPAISAYRTDVSKSLAP